ncbi:hypothetical protein [Puerhibacterium sp. TATVAM-FAB25]|uniref:hypothetical protein n=1 Tax=Puerhibacterium sp. TATVAM-FAB25 TaxID=3093699 RepID=UPI00397D9E5B
MTKNRGLKDKIRAYMSAHGVNYTTARRAVLAGAAAVPPAAPPKPPFAAASDQGWIDAPPSADELVGGVLTGLLEDLLNESLAPYGMPTPPGAPLLLRDPWVSEVVPLDWSLSLHHVDSYDGGELANATMRAEVVLTGELDLADALAAEADGLARRQPPGDTGSEVTVVLTSAHELEVEAAVLYETVAEIADLQEVLSRRWVTE